MSVNINQDIIDIFLLHNSKKIQSDTEALNYHRIIAKDIGVKNNFEDIVCNIVNNIEVTISIKFKNKFSSGAMSIKDRLKFFNQGVNNQKKANENQFNPKRLSMPIFTNNNQLNNEQKKQNKEEIKKDEEKKNKEGNKKEEENKKEEVNKKEEISKKEEVNI